MSTKEYKIKQLINKINTGTSAVQRDMGRAFVQRGINQLTDIVDQNRQNKLSNILEDIIKYQQAFIQDFNYLQYFSGEQLDLKQMFDQFSNGSGMSDNTILDLSSLFNDTDEVQAQYAIRGMNNYLAFKNAAIDAFTENLDIQNQLHQHTNFYDMIAIKNKEGKTDLFMLDTKALKSFMKETNFVDFIPQGLGGINSAKFSGEITDYRLTLNPGAAYKDDAILKYFNSKLTDAKSGVYKLEDTISSQIFGNQQYQDYATRQYSNRPSGGQLVEPVLSSLLLGNNIQETMNSGNLYQYSTGGFDSSKKGSGQKFNYKFNIAPSTFGGAIGDSLGTILMSKAENGKGNTFSFTNQGGAYSGRNWEYSIGNFQIKALDFNKESRVSWGSLSSIYQNTAMYASQEKFEKAKDSYGEYLARSYSDKKSNSRVQKEIENFARETIDFTQSMADKLAEALDNAGISYDKDELTNIIDEYISDSEEFKDAMNEYVEESEDF